MACGALCTALLFAALLCVAAAGEGDEVCQVGSGCRDSRGVAAADGYFWPRRGGNLRSNGFTPSVGPSNISGPPTWIWDNVEDELHRHSPVIDGEGNLYMVTSFGWVRKFTPDGDVLWAWRSSNEESRTSTGPSLYNGSLYFLSVGANYQAGKFLGGYAFALNMRTGELQWRAPMPQHYQEHDSQTVTAVDGVLLAAMQSKDRELGSGYWAGSNKVVALSTADGSFKWDYDFDGVVWNFNPSIPGDGSLLFSSNCGVAHRLELQTGRLLWKAPFPEPGHWCSTSGGTLGPDGRFYVATNYFGATPQDSGTPFEGFPRCRPEDCPEGMGMLLVYNVADGSIEMKKRLALESNQYPALGTINGKLTIVLSLGSNPRLGVDIFKHIGSYVPSFIWDNSDWIKGKIFTWQYQYAWVRRLLGITPMEHNAVVALDASTGDLIWHYADDPWDHWACAGDEERFLERYIKAHSNPRVEVICGPDSWGIPTIGGDGTVYASSGTTGNLYAIRDEDGDGKLEPSEVSIHRFGQAFLNGPALAPGVLAVTPCWGPMHVWRSP